jgi:hypothetical protein
MTPPIFVDTEWGLVEVVAAAGPLPTPCLVTDYARDPDGYATTKRGRKSIRVHVAACEWAHGPRPFDGAVVLHACDNPPCCNPEHLSWGTQRENTADRVAKGRSARGERNGKSKLTDAQRAEVARSGLPDETLMRLYGVSQSTIRRAKAAGRGTPTPETTNP